jgi:hypothetical protein
MLPAPPKEDATEQELPVWASLWLSTPNFARRSAEVVLSLIYLLALLFFFGFTVSKSMSEGKMQTVTSIGQPTPWFVWTSIDEKDGFSFRHSFNISRGRF